MSARGPHDAGCDAVHGCITCSDSGVPMRVVAIESESELATCATDDGAQCEVMTGLIGPVAPGDVLLVHAGTALVRIASAAIERRGSAA